MSSSLITLATSHLPCPSLSPSTLPVSPFRSVHSSLTTPPTARPLKPADQCQSAHQVAQQVEVARTIVRRSRATPAPLGLDFTVHGPVFPFLFFPLVLTRSLSLTLSRIIMITVPILLSSITCSLLTLRLPFVRLDSCLGLSPFSSLPRGSCHR